jgi:hypothetical protein
VHLGATLFRALEVQKRVWTREVQVQAEAACTERCGMPITARAATSFSCMPRSTGLRPSNPPRGWSFTGRPPEHRQWCTTSCDTFFSSAERSACGSFATLSDCLCLSGAALAQLLALADTSGLGHHSWAGRHRPRLSVAHDSRHAVYERFARER